MLIESPLTGGGGDKKPSKIKSSKPPSPTPAELAAANKFAKEMALRRGLISGENTHVGNQIPKFFDARTGKELGVGDVEPGIGRLDTKVPLYVKSLEWDAQSNLPYYIDEKTNDIKYVAKDLFYSPRFRKPITQQSILDVVKR